MGAALCAVACSSSSPAGTPSGSGGTPGGAGSGGSPAGAGGAACPSASASVTCAPDMAWYVIADSASQTSPASGQALTLDPTSNTLCLSGVAAQNAGLAVDFNAAGSNGGQKGIWDARSYGGVAFDFSGSMIPDHGMLVSFPFAGQGPDGPPTYQGTAQPYSALSAGQHVVIHWDAVGGPYGAATPVLFDPSRLQSMQVQAMGSASGPTPFQFCIANLTPLPD